MELLLFGQAHLLWWLFEWWLTQTSQGTLPHKTLNCWLRAWDANPPGSGVSLPRAETPRPGHCCTSWQDAPLQPGCSGHGARQRSSHSSKPSLKEKLSAKYRHIYLLNVTVNDVRGKTTSFVYNETVKSILMLWGERVENVKQTGKMRHYRKTNPTSAAVLALRTNSKRRQQG